MIRKNPALQSLPNNSVGARERIVGTKGSTTNQQPSNTIRRDENGINKVRPHHALLQSLQATSPSPIVKRKKRMFHIVPVVPVLKCQNGSRDCVEAPRDIFPPSGVELFVTHGLPSVSRENLLKRRYSKLVQNASERAATE